MGIWLLITGILFILNGIIASDDSLERAKLYMEACAKQELFASVPPLNFTCENKIAGGYYADVDTGCHIFHLCAPSNLQPLTDHPFCCHPQLVFDQRFLVCDRPENVDCPVSNRYFSDQFDGPVRVQQRENERQSRADQQNDDDDNGNDDDEDEDDEQQVENPAVTLPPAFRQR